MRSRLSDRLLVRIHGRRRIFLAVGAASLIALATIVFGMRAASDHSDAISVERQIRIAERAIAASIDELPAAQVPFAVWDDMVLKARGAPDVPWFMANVGGQFDFAYPGAKTYVVDARDRFVYGYDRLRPVSPAQFARLQPQLQYFLDVVRGKAIPADYRHSRLFGIGTPPQPTGPGKLRRVEYVVYAAHLALIDGKPAAVSAMRVVPTEWSVPQRRGEEALLVTVRFLNGAFLETLSRRNLIDRPRLAVLGSAPRPGEVSLPLRGIRGQLLADLRWYPEMPGTRLLAQLRPYALGAVVLLLGTLIMLALVLSRTLAELAASERSARRDADHDALTGLPNRTVLLRQLTTAITRARAGQRATLLLMDLDRFKEANDTFGHAAGDQILRELAERLRTLVDHDTTVVRLGGDEFAMVIATDDRRRIGATCERINALAARPFELSEGPATIGVSIGAAVIDAFHLVPEDALRSADRALYSAKASGRGTYAITDRAGLVPAE